MTIAIRFENVSKKFTLRTSSKRSIQELLTGFWHKLGHPQPPEEIWPLKNLSFEVQQGSTLGIVGPNGAGKSTILKLIAGILRPSSGRIRVAGPVAAMLELGTGFHPDLTGRENLLLYGSMFGLSLKEMECKVPAIIEFSELGRFIDMPVKNYSSGMYVRLGFAAAIQVEADILLFDEVLVVGDYSFQQKCWQKLKELQASAKTIILISHDLRVVQELCDQAILIEQGILTASGDVNQVAEAYYMSQSSQQEVKPEEITFNHTPMISDSKAKITNVELLNEHGEKIEVIEENQPVIVRVSYKGEPSIKDALFGVQIWGEVHERVGNQVVCHNTNTAFHELAPIEINDEGTFEIQYPALSLSAGAYFLRAAIFSPDPTRAPYATSFRVSPFEVKRSYKDGVGLVAMPHQWKM